MKNCTKDWHNLQYIRDYETCQDCGEELEYTPPDQKKKHLLSAVDSIEHIEEVARQYFEFKYPLMDLTNDEEKCEIDWWDMLEFVQHVLSCHCR